MGWGQIAAGLDYAELEEDDPDVLLVVVLVCARIHGHTPGREAEGLRAEDGEVVGVDADVTRLLMVKEDSDDIARVVPLSRIMGRSVRGTYICMIGMRSVFRVLVAVPMRDRVCLLKDGGSGR